MMEQRNRGSRRNGLFAFGFLLLWSHACLAVGERRINGTFLQPLRLNNQWTGQEWRDLFSTLDQLKIVDIVIQWSVFENTSFYEHDNSPVMTVLRLADEYHMSVIVGLAFEPAYWQHVDTSLQDRGSYMNAALNRSTAVAERLAPLVRRHASFRGWYIPQEIDNVNWVEPAARAVLLRYIRELSARLHKLTSSKIVSVSGFANSHSSSVNLAELWSDLFLAGIDVALFQDGVGAGKLSLAQVKHYMDVVSHMANKHGRELWPVVELFSQIKPGVGDVPNAFKAAASNLERICAQIAVVKPYAQKIVGFAVPNYMSFKAERSGRALFNRYLKTGC